MTNTILPVAIVGAGPIGLAAAAYLIERDQPFIIFEHGDQAGTNILLGWAHIKMLSPWMYNVDAACVRLLESHDWQHPSMTDRPTGGELVNQYLRPLSELPEIALHLYFEVRVVKITRNEHDDEIFTLRVEFVDGSTRHYEARAVIDASGTWQNASPIGLDYLPVIGEKANRDHIFYGIPNFKRERGRFAGSRVMVIGSDISTLHTLNELIPLKRDDTSIFWAIREKDFDKDNITANITFRHWDFSKLQGIVNHDDIHLLNEFRIREIVRAGDSLNVIAETPTGLKSEIIDEIIVVTGGHPDLEMLRELRLNLDPLLQSPVALAPMITTNHHYGRAVYPHGEMVLRHPEKNFYIVGIKSYGRVPEFVLATGYTQVRSVVAALVGDWDAARDIHLNLPEHVIQARPEPIILSAVEMLIEILRLHDLGQPHDS